MLESRRSAAVCALLLLLGLLSPTSCSRNAAFIGYTERDGNSFSHFVITTKFGTIRIRPRTDISPGIVKLVYDLAVKGNCPRCQFYRHEPVPPNWGKDNWYWGPPYALLQGSLADVEKHPPFEGNPVVKKGDVCIIPGSSEFFIATADHDEWGTAHSVWGKVEDEESWATIKATPVEPFTTITDSGNITTRWLTEEAKIPFKLSIE